VGRVDGHPRCQRHNTQQFPTMHTPPETETGTHLAAVNGQHTVQQLRAVRHCVDAGAVARFAAVAAAAAAATTAARERVDEE
jgi:hypothetical protein